MSQTWPRIFFTALAITIAVIFYASLYPFEYRVRANGSGPLAVLIQSAGDPFLRGDFTANILFYVPLGLFGILAMSSKTSLGQRFALTVLLGAVLTIGNELMQYYVRDTSAFDVYANLLGTLLGTVGGILPSRRFG